MAFEEKLIPALFPLASRINSPGSVRPASDDVDSHSLTLLAALPLEGTLVGLCPTRPPLKYNA